MIKELYETAKQYILSENKKLFYKREYILINKYYKNFCSLKYLFINIAK